MKKLLTFLFSTILYAANGQTVFDDWETSGIRNVNYYNSGSGANYIISATNPDATINTSATVGQYDRVAGTAPLDNQLVGCAWSVPVAWSSFDMSQYDIFHIDVYSTTAFTLRFTLKDDDGAGGGTDLQTIDLNYSAPLSTWKTLDFDFSAYKNYVPAGKIQVLYLFNPGATTASTHYVDNFSGTLSATSSVHNSVNSVSKLNQNSPNPFNSSTTISYSLKQAEEVSLIVYDALGKPVTSLLNNKFHSAGDYSVNLNADSFKEGIYYYTLTVGEIAETKRMVLQK